jgi:hypothetical protein
LFFLFLSTLSYAQKSDSTEHTKKIVSWKYNSIFSRRDSIEIDTMASEFQSYGPNAQISDYQIDLASFGSPAFSLIYSLAHKP